MKKYERKGSEHPANVETDHESGEEQYNRNKRKNHAVKRKPTGRQKKIRSPQTRRTGRVRHKAKGRQRQSTFASAELKTPSLPDNVAYRTACKKYVTFPIHPSDFLIAILSPNSAPVEKATNKGECCIYS